MRPARQVISRSPHRSVGRIAAPWLEGTQFLEHESETEKSFLQLAVTCPVVRDIKAQPFKLSYMLDGQSSTNIPDYLLTLSAGTGLVVEVKPEKFVPRYKDRFDAISLELAKSGLTYYAVTHCAPGDAAVNEAALWRRYARTVADEATCSHAKSLASSQGGMTFADLLLAGIPAATIYHLLGRGQLVSSSGFALTPVTRLLPFMKEESLDERVYFEHWIGCTPWRTHLAAGATP